MNGSIEAAFVGRIIDEPHLKQSAAGKPWASLRLAVGDGETAQYVRVAIFGEMAEQIAATVEKGTKLYVEGSIRLDRWKSASGEDRSGLSVAAWKVEKMGASAIGRNKPAKPKPISDHQAPPNGRATARQANTALDDTIPF